MMNAYVKTSLWLLPILIGISIIATTIQPSSYRWLLPNGGIKYIDSYELNELATYNNYPSMNQIIPQSFMYFLIFGIIRIILNHYIFKPLAIYALNIDIININSNNIIDKFLINNTNIIIDIKIFDNLCSISSMTPRDVRKYIWTKRRNNSINGRHNKFLEALWRFIYYLIFTILAYICLFQPKSVEWINDTSKYWQGWPYQPIDDNIKLLYQLQLACYFHQLSWIELPLRSDSKEMMLHHFATISLIGLSYITSFTRIGTTIFLAHDVADIFLESAKCFNYTSRTVGRKHLSIYCDVLFGIFAIIFFVTRLILYPRYMVWSLVYEAPKLLGGMWPGWYAFAGLLTLLQLLHIFWFYLIVRMISKLITTGIDKDVRSDDEDCTEEYNDSPTNRKKLVSDNKEEE